MIKHLLIIVLSFLLLASCQKQATEFDKEQKKYVDELGWLLNADPNKDVELAISKEDFRFKGIYGYSLSVPRVGIRCLDVDNEVDPIKGTTDAVLGYEHAKLIAVAKEYADFYNMRMRLYLEENRGFECNS